MTQEQFYLHKFRPTDRVVYRKTNYNVLSVDYNQELIEIDNKDSRDSKWIRREEAELNILNPDSMPCLRLFVFEPNETGMNSYYAIAESFQDAKTAIFNIKDESADIDRFIETQEQYKIFVFEIGKATWSDNC